MAKELNEDVRNRTTVCLELEYCATSENNSARIHFELTHLVWRINVFPNRIEERVFKSSQKNDHLAAEETRDAGEGSSYASEIG